ncbi:hypothetical protein PFICI_14088 [Pestalotiopsis fici W106-1]|uniref:Transcription factor domain-containing protein n=1 Tax=Pestalotiopsis fici (strain W106-1 / CGMCC3.15140) TaxID=1229662 RepID=W3WM57_PESFW|nr:uncharacterized protein PFICI_14088 [Pestalotiopsis fici W106-1]ETS74222.1 hypothetical protein PFICI_14088 [Pestalotiopsis fici W106-1]
MAESIRAARPLLEAASLASNDKVALLEQRLNAVEGRLRGEIDALKSTVNELRTANVSDSSPIGLSESSISSRYTLGTSSHNVIQDRDNVTIGSVGEQQWQALHSFYNENCKTVIAFMDDQFYPPKDLVRQHPLLSTVICLIASRAIMPERYQSFLDEADDLVKKTFGGPTPDLLTVKALMLLAVWTGRSRLWGYVASVAAELRLNTAVIRLGDDAFQHSVDIVDHARTWLSLCCFDLVMNLNRPFVINRMRDYLPFTANLLSSPHRRPVDYRIAAYIEGFAIAADAKTQLQNTKLHVSPLPSDVTSLLDLSNQKIDRWFYEINNKMNPLYQTFQDRQDRNRFLVPYSFLKIYINGFALYGVQPDSDAPDRIRLGYVQEALDSAILVIRTQCDSPALRKGLRYTMDYNGITTYHAINYILKAMTAAHQHLNYSMVFPALHQAAQMFEGAGSVDAANDIRKEQDKLAMLTNTVLSPEVLEHGNAEREANQLFDIPSFWDEANWDDAFPEMNVYTLD